ncbi:hypothetical protein Ancab_031510 [Ancistrocladus abbreviatus]
MAEFPPNLDDGELWIPSDMLPKEVVPSTEIHPHCGSSSSHNHHHQQHKLSFTAEDLARHFASMALLDHPPQRAVKSLLPPPQRFGPAAVQAPPVAGGGCGITFRPEAELGLYYGGLATGSGYLARDPLLEYRLLKSARYQAEGLMETRRAAANRQLQAQQNRLQNRVRASQGGGIKMGGGFTRDCGGTGVFLPRIDTAMAAALAAQKTTHVESARRKQGVRTGQDAQIAQQRENARRSGLDKVEEYQRQFPPDLGLPKDWTY